MSSSSPTTPDEVLRYYQGHFDREEATAKDIASKWNSVGYLRGILFLAALAGLLMGFANVLGMGAMWWVLAGIVFVVFVFVALYHEGMNKQLRRAMLLSRMHRESVARCERDWDNIKVPQIEIPKHFVPISKDLDLLGNSSVYKLIGVTRTPLGTEMLRSWIIEGALDDEIKLRQEAVAELRNEFDWRLRFRLHCEQLASTQSGPSRFVEWCESPNWFNAGRIWVLYLTRLTALVSILAFLFLLSGIVPLGTSGPIVLVTLAITCAINFFRLRVLFGFDARSIQYRFIASGRSESLC